MVQQAIILAAGMGKRLGKYTQNGTKCMVQVNGISLVEHALSALRDAGVLRVVLVIGYRGQQLRAFLENKFPDLELAYVENPIYDKTNNIYSLYLARDYLAAEDTLLLESDLIFESAIIRELVDHPEPNLAVVSPFEPWMDGTVTMLDEEDNIVSVVDKKHFDWEKVADYYKTVNIYKFSADFSGRYYLPFLEAYLKSFGDNEYYEQVLKVLAFLEDSGLKGFKVPGRRWYEIDDPQDLSVAQTLFGDDLGRLDRMQKRYGGYWRFPSMIDFCYLVNPYFPPKRMVHEIQASFTDLMSQYPSGAAVQASLAAKVFGTAEEQIVVGNGAAELIAHLFNHISGRIAIPVPSFNEYAERAGSERFVPIETTSRDFAYTADDLIAFADKERPGALVLINPDNPSGNFLNRPDVERVLKVCAKLSCILVLDESFGDFVEGGRRFTFLTEDFLSALPSLFIVKSISKSYGVPGFRLGVLASGDTGMIAKIKKALPIWNINSFGEFFLQIVDKYKKDYAAACDRIVAERNRFSAALTTIPGFMVFPSQANYLMVELSGKVPSRSLTERLLQEHRLFVKDLSGKVGFPPERSFMRFAVRNTADNDKLVAALKAIIE